MKTLALHNLLEERCGNIAEQFTEWREEQDIRFALPRAVDILLLPEVRAILEQGKDIEGHSIRCKFPEFVLLWKQACDHQLRSIIRYSLAHIKNIPPHIDPLSLASMVFTCAKCKANACTNNTSERPPPLYPAILTHECLYDDDSNWDTAMKTTPATLGTMSGMNTTAITPGGKWPDGTYETIVAEICLDLFGSRNPWSCDLLGIGSWHRRAREIIEACGQDPYTVTTEEMDFLDARLYCMECTDLSSCKRFVMHWRYAASVVISL